MKKGTKTNTTQLSERKSFSVLIVYLLFLFIQKRESETDKNQARLVVAYNYDFHISKVEKILSKQARTDSLKEDQGSFSWLWTKDKADENAEFIFGRNVRVTKTNTEGSKFHKPNFQSLKEKFNGFSLTYIKWENQGE